jgi:membrane protease YdiL (CAAX protease family)
VGWPPQVQAVNPAILLDPPQPTPSALAGVGPDSVAVDRLAWLSWLVILALGALAWGPQRIWLLLLVAPWVEEVLWRHGLQRELQDRLGASRAIFICALVFAVAHVAAQLAQPGPTTQTQFGLAAATFVPAWLLGWAYARSGSLGLCVAGHAAANAAWLGVFAEVLA